MSKATTTTFSVSDVSPATTPLPEVTYKEAVESLLRAGNLGWVDDEIDDKPSDTLSGSATTRPLEACARYHGRLVSGVPFHPFVAAVHKAFVDHRPLTLSPDTIWLMIIQGVANHINAHAEELRPRFVRHQDKLQVNVRRDDFVKGSPENPWAEVIDDEIDDEIDDIHSEPDEVEGLGKEEGLKAPTAKKRLNRLDLRRRQGKEEPHLEDPDLDDALGEDIEDDPEYLVGAWLRRTPQSGRDKNQSMKDDHEDPDSYTIGTRLADLPSGLSKAPFRWNFLDRSFDMEFLGGFVGVTQDQETLTLRPEIGWAVRRHMPTGRPRSSRCLRFRRTS